MKNALTVSELTREIKKTLEDRFDSVVVVGEISNFKAHVSGHWYFTLKDSDSQISCTMWRGKNSYVFFTPQDGMKITITGKITVYPPRGNYQVDVNSMSPAGEGELQAAFEKLKKRLSDEGLFNSELKKDIPSFPQKIGIVTASDGAAFRDMISVASRRFPLAEIILYPSKVQGEGAAAEIAAGIKTLNQLPDIDVMIIGRGGGSLEDLWAFNEEIVARAVFNSKIPVISAVGHEIDFTISDFAADLRAPTPSAAMELATPDKDKIFAFINEFSYNSTANICDLAENYKDTLKRINNSYGFRSPFDHIRNKTQFLDNLIFRIQSSTDIFFSEKNNSLKLLTKIIENNDISTQLKKGFALVSQNGKIITRSLSFEKGTETTIRFFDGEIKIN